MEKYLFFIVWITISCAVNSQKNMNSYLEIDFQDFFKSDTVSLSINQYLIFSNKALNSDFSTGITDVKVKIYKYKNKGFVKLDNDSIVIGKLTEPIIINAILNGKKNEYKVDVEGGKYIGLTNNGGNNFKLYQSKEPFEYD